MFAIAVVFIVGFLCGVLGLGGGIMLAPLLVYMDTLPEVLPATSNTVVMFNATASLLE